MSTRLRPVALTLIAMLALAGCGAPRSGLAVEPGQLAPAPGARAEAGRAAPTVMLAPTSTDGRVQPEDRQAPKLPTVRVEATPAEKLATPAEKLVTQTERVERGWVRVLGHTAVSREELREDAEDAGYSVQSGISVPRVTGYVRRSSGASYLLEAKKNHLGLKTPTPTTYTLNASDMKIHLWLGEHVNKKVHVEGLFGANNAVTVTFADKALDLGFLTDWWTKGKVRGHVVGTDGMPLVNVEIKARSAEGYVYLANSDDTGAFAVKNLTPGFYQVWLSKLGYGVVSTAVEVKAHHAAELESRLYKN